MSPLFTRAGAERWRIDHAQQLRDARLARLHALATRAESYTLFGMCVALVLAAIFR